jgi:hypothetical protein
MFKVYVDYILFDHNYNALIVAILLIHQQTERTFSKFPNWGVGQICPPKIH